MTESTVKLFLPARHITSYNFNYNTWLRTYGSITHKLVEIVNRDCLQKFCTDNISLRNNENVKIKIEF